MFPDYVVSQDPSEHSIFGMTFANSCLKAKVLAFGRSAQVDGLGAPMDEKGERERGPGQPPDQSSLHALMCPPVDGNAPVVWLSPLCKD